MSRVVKFGLVATLLVLSGCDDNPFADTAAEQTFLASDFFTKPFVLHVSRDAYTGAQLAASMNGVDSRPTNGALYNTLNFLPCRASTDVMVPNSMSATVDSYNFQEKNLLEWLTRKQLLEARTYTIQYTQIVPPGGYGTENIFTCLIVTDAMRQYLPAEQQGINLHGGFDMPMLYRKFIAWTYENRYEADLFGMGKVKIFAGTFTYTVASVLPGVYVTGTGTGSVKVLLNPDTGKWQVDSTQFQDPSLTLQ